MPTTWNSADKATQITLSNSDLTATLDSFAHAAVRATTSLSSGKAYIEYVCNVASLSGWAAGFATSAFNVAGTSHLGATATSWAYRRDQSTSSIIVYQNTEFQTVTHVVTGSVISLALDFSAGEIYCAHNGTWQNSADPAAGTNPNLTSLAGTVFPAWSAYLGTGDEITIRTAAEDMQYTIPTGYSAWDTLALSGDITLGLTGLSSTGTRGILGLEGDVFVLLSGISGSSSIGAASIGTGSAIAIAGIGGRGDIGALHAYPILNALTGESQTYTLTLTGTPNIVLPMASFSARRRNGEPTYLTVVVPNGPAYAELIEARLAGQLVIDQVVMSGGTPTTGEVVRVNLESTRYDRGARSQSATLTGHRTATTTAPNVIIPPGVSYRAVIGGKRRLRCQPNFAFAPGDGVFDEGVLWTAAEISYSISPTSATMEIAE